MSLVRRAVRAVEALRGTRTTGWIPLAFAEDGLPSPYPEAERFTAERLGAAAAGFNRSAFEPPVIVGSAAGVAGPVHDVGEYLPPVGRLVDLQFDGTTLWGKVMEVVERTGRGRFEDAVSKGMTARSLGMWLNGVPSVGAQAGAPAVRHLALLSGETPGQMHLPSLTSYLTNALGADAATRAADSTNSPVAVRTLDPATWKDGARSAAEETTMPEQSDASLINEAVSSAVQRQLGPALEAALKPVLSALATVNTEVGGFRTALAEADKSNRRREAEAAVAELVSSGRVAPAEQSAEVEALVALPADASGKRLALLRARKSKTSETRTTFIGGEEQQTRTGKRTAPPFAAGLETLYHEGAISESSAEQLADLVNAVGGAEGLKDSSRVAQAMEALGWGAPQA